jgi:hypothetical protein
LSVTLKKNRSADTLRLVAPAPIPLDNMQLKTSYVLEACGVRRSGVHTSPTNRMVSLNDLKRFKPLILPDGLLRFSDAISRLAEGMWGGLTTCSGAGYQAD